MRLTALWWMALFCWWFAVAPSWAVAQQTELEPIQGRNLVGPVLPAVTGDVADPLTLWAPLDNTRQWSIGVVGEVAAGTSARFEVPFGQTEPELVGELERFGALNLTGQVEFTEFVGLGATLPVVLGTAADNLDGLGTGGGGPTFGNLAVWVPLGLVRNPVDEGFSLAGVVSASLPTGRASRYVADPDLAVGVLVAGGYGTRILRVDANVGVVGSPVREDDVQRYGGAELPLGLGVGVRVVDRLFLGAEVRGDVDLGSGTITLTDGGVEEDFRASAVPVEGFVTLRTSFGGGRHTSGTFAVAGGGVGLTSGIGAARGGRGLLGVGYRHVDAPEPLVPPFVLRTVDEAGQPVVGATVRQGSREMGRTGPNGEITVDLEGRTGRALIVEAEGTEPEIFDTSAVPTDLATPPIQVVVLRYRPRTVPVAVTDEDGEAVIASWTARPLDNADADPVRGEGPVELRPGAYDVRFEANDAGAQHRQLRVPKGRSESDPVDVVLLPPEGPASLAVRVANLEGDGVEGAQVLVDGRMVGTTGDDGRLRVDALTDQPHDVEVQHPAYTTAALEVPVDTDPTAIVLARQKGSVRVTVRNARGDAVPDAVVRFVGPRRLPPMSLGVEGQRVQVLGAGTWSLIVSSPTYGIQERIIEVPPDGWELIDVLVVLQSGEAGGADVVIRVMDSTGAPVDGATLRLDEQHLGSTSTGGQLALEGLTTGPRILEVAGEDLRPVEPMALELVPGMQEAMVKVDWEPGLVDVIARSPEGPVSDGVIRFLGPVTQPPVALSAQGRQRVTLDPGTWTVLLTSARFGAQEREVHIDPDARIRHVVEFLVQPTEGGQAELALTVNNPLGRPVDGAQVALNAQPVGATSNMGRLRVQNLAAGARTVDVEATLYERRRQTVDLGPGRVDQTLVLDWAPAVVRVVVQQNGRPVPDAVVRFLGATRMAPRPADNAGEVFAQLAPGTWTVLATSARAGIGDTVVELSPTSGLTEVVVDVTGPEAGRTDLAVRVTDPLGRAVEDAMVAIDGPVSAELPARKGLVVARGMGRGEVRIGVRAPGHESVQTTLMLDEDRMERVVRLPFVEVPLLVQARDENGAPIAGARVSIEGPVADVDQVITDRDGEATAQVVPGAWTVIAASGERSASTTLTMDPNDVPTPIELVLTEGNARLTTERVVITERVRFDFNQATLRPESLPLLEAVSRIIRSEPSILVVEVQGHTDSLGTADVNQRLSDLRADVVVAKLVDLGVAPEKLVRRGYGRRVPLGDNATRQGRAANRRVEFAILEQAGPSPDEAP